MRNMGNHQSVKIFEQHTEKSTTPKGEVYVEWTCSNNGMQIIVTTPEDVPVEIKIPETILGNIEVY